MQKWEYHFIQVNSYQRAIVTKINGSSVTNPQGFEEADTYLKKKGDEGWEMVSAIPLDANNHLLYLKRAK